MFLDYRAHSYISYCKFQDLHFAPQRDKSTYFLSQSYASSVLRLCSVIKELNFGVINISHHAF